MEFFIISPILLLIIIFILHRLLKSSPKSKLPPGPKPWPIIGNVHLLGSNPHRSVTQLSKKYGPLMTLKLGSITTIVISSPEVAKEMFTKHDLAFSSRHHPDSSRAADSHKLAVLWLRVGPKWRDLRKIMAIQLFTNRTLDASQALRKKKVDELVQFVRTYSEKGLAVDIAEAVSTTSLNLLSNTFFSMDLGSYDSSASKEFINVARNLIDEAVKPNVSDLFPILRGLDLQGIRRRMTVYVGKIMEFYESIIDERFKDETVCKDDVLDTLLKLVKKDELTLDDVKYLLLTLFLAATDTSIVTLEWAMAELLRHPEKMMKAQAEIDEILGKCQPCSVKESNISNLPYIQAIVKETLRLHPPLPFLIPRQAGSNVELCGYYVPKNAQVWVNIWSISRDPTVWTNPELFMPERFLSNEIDYKGQHFEFMPFGTGRRICPGISLAHIMVHLTLANLLHSFNWKLDHGINSEDLDMQEKFGFSIKKSQPLQAIPFPR